MDIMNLNNLFLTIEGGQPVEMSRSDYLQKDYGLSWSSQEWKSGDGEHDRSGKPEIDVHKHHMSHKKIDVMKRH